ncbi:hypothetical protein DL96DRAFT_1564661 [Flagelloscypha sp. PMI_526]|nr:hypothetical protein DL96DRAFT_1564661 [Flagelloscypha sp. PMI_526]
MFSQTTTLANELLLHILEYFDADEAIDTHTLRHLSLTHSFFLPHAQARLFHRVVLDFAWADIPFNERGTCSVPTPSEILAEILEESPQIRAYVRDLHLENGALTDIYTGQILCFLISVESLCLAAPFTMGWGDPRLDYPLYGWDEVEIQAAIIEEVFPTISSLRIQGFHNFPFHEVVPLCPNLKRLETYYNPPDFDELEDLPVRLAGTSKSRLPLWKRLCFSGETSPCPMLQRMIEQTQPSLEILWLGSRLSEESEVDMSTETKIMSIVGPTLTSLTLTLDCFSNGIDPGWNSRAFHLDSLPSLRKFTFAVMSPFSTEARRVLKWAVIRLSTGCLSTHPLTRLHINILAGAWKTEPDAPAHPDPWTRLDGILALFKHLMRLVLRGFLTYGSLGKREVWQEEQAAISRKLPVLMRRTNFIEFVEGEEDTIESVFGNTEAILDHNAQITANQYDALRTMNASYGLQTIRLSHRKGLSCLVHCGSKIPMTLATSPTFSSLPFWFASAASVPALSFGAWLRWPNPTPELCPKQSRTPLPPTVLVTSSEIRTMRSRRAEKASHSSFALCDCFGMKHGLADSRPLTFGIVKVIWRQRCAEFEWEEFPLPSGPEELLYRLKESSPLSSEDVTVLGPSGDSVRPTASGRCGSAFSCIRFVLAWGLSCLAALRLQTLLY